MIELFLDGKPAVLKDNVSIKLTRENVYFTKSGSYTYDVELPLQCPENRAIFGSINRKDVEAQYQEFTALFRVDNKVLIDGRAVINSVTDTSVKVQLLGGNADMNFVKNGNEIYIDELDLGDWMTNVRIYTTNPEHSVYHGNAMGMMYLESEDMRDEGSSSDQYTYWKKRWWMNENGDQHTIDKGLMFPVINESADYNAESSHLDSGAIVNGYILRFDNGRYWPQFRLTWPNQDPEGTSDYFPQVIPSFQPMLIMIIRKVLKAAGYPLKQSSEVLLLSNSLFRHIFIVTANNRIEINKALPHWTFNEFLTQIERFLGIVITADETTKESFVVSRDEWWDSTPIAIDDVVDEYTIEINKSETSDITNGNVGFADIADNYQHVSDDIMKAIVVDKTRFSGFSDLRVAIYNGSVDENDKDTVFEVYGHHFILCSDDGNQTWYWQEVNQYRMLQRNTEKSDVDVSLKIKPCPITTWLCPVVVTTPLGHDTTKVKDTELYTIPMNVFTRPDNAHIGTDNVDVDTSKLDIQALLNDEQEVPDSDDGEDVMYVGVLPTELPELIDHEHSDIPFYYPQPYSFPNIRVDGLGTHRDSNQNEFLTLNKFTDSYDSKTLYTESLESASLIETTVKYCLKFVSDKVLEPTGVFIINNQKFACEKMEYQITSKGVSPLVTGYFYRLKESPENS